MGTVAGQDETVGIINRAGHTVRIVAERTERTVRRTTDQRTRTLADVIAAVGLLLLGIWIGRR